MRLLSVLLFALIGMNLNAQFGLSLGVGVGYSTQADSYIKVEEFKTFEYTGFRPFIVEGRLDYTFPSKTVIYGIYQISPKITTITPFQFNYSAFGLEQRIPNSQLFITGAYGWNKGRDSNSISEGQMFLAGVGFMSELTRIQLSFLSGSHENQVSFLNERETRMTLGLSFRIIGRNQIYDFEDW